MKFIITILFLVFSFSSHAGSPPDLSKEKINRLANYILNKKYGAWYQKQNNGDMRASLAFDGFHYIVTVVTSASENFKGFRPKSIDIRVQPEQNYLDHDRDNVFYVSGWMNGNCFRGVIPDNLSQDDFPFPIRFSIPNERVYFTDGSTRDEPKSGMENRDNFQFLLDQTVNKLVGFYERSTQRKVRAN